MNGEVRGRVAARLGAVALVLAALALVRPALAGEAAPASHAADACIDSLLSAVHVTVEYVDSTRRDGGTGSTVTQVDQRNQFTYTYRWVDRGDSVDVVMAVKASLEITPVHTMRLPSGFTDSIAWYRRLCLHELDRIAVGSDERPVLLARWLVAHLPPVTRRVPRGTPVGSALAKEAIGEEIGKRYRAVVNLMQAQMARLDSLTAHGAVPLPNRAAFFDGLYTREGLARAGFEYIADVEPLLAQPRYQNAPRPRCDATP